MGPALDHDVVDVLGAVLRPGQALPFLVNLMQDLPARVVRGGGGRLGEQTTHLCTFYLPRPDLQLKMLPDMPVHHGTSSGEALSPESGTFISSPTPCSHPHIPLL